MPTHYRDNPNSIYQGIYTQTAVAITMDIKLIVNEVIKRRKKLLARLASERYATRLRASASR
jgi:hypothetical protein